MTNPTGTMNEALAPLAMRLRRAHAIVEPVSQINLQIHPIDHGDAFQTARQRILDYVKRRSGGDLTTEALAGRSFALDDLGSRRVEGVAIDDPRYWTVRFDDDDTTIASRHWVIETALAEQAVAEPILFGLRLQCVARGQNPPYDRTVPTFVRDLITSCDARLDGRRVSLTPWIVDSEERVSDLVMLLESDYRKADVIVFALPENSADVSQTVISASDVARDIAGAAHVVIITSDASFHLSDAVGREFSVFRQAVRTYRPGFDPGTEEPFAHPLGMPNRVSSFSGGPEGYKRFLISDVLRRTVEGRDSQKRMPSFAEAKRTAAELRRRTAQESGSSADELLKLADQDIVELKQALKGVEEEYIGLLEAAEAERDDASAEVLRLQGNIFYLQQRLKSLSGQDIPDTSQEFPDTLEYLDAWAKEHLAGAVELHNRALRGAKTCEYEDISLIYGALLLLRDFYVPMKREGGIDLKRAFEDRCKELGLDEQPTFSGSRAGEQGDTYFIQLGGRRVELDRHLKKGAGREPRNCFRLYFVWDESTSQVVVGWLPSHLTTRAS